MKKVLIGIAILALFGFVSISSATVVQLKNGEKVEGKFMGGTKDVINFEVASQKIAIQISDISLILFDKGALNTIDTSKNSSFLDDAKEALYSLNSIKSIVNSRVNYREYSKRILDTKIIIDNFLNTHNDTINPTFNISISDAMGFYETALDCWTFEINEPGMEKGMLFMSFFQNKYIMEKCERCKEQLVASVKDENLSFDARPFLFQKAEEAIMEAENALN